MSDHAMADLETLGVTADAVILSVGVYVYQGTNTGKTFYMACDPASQPERVIRPDTVSWWQKQSDEAKKVFEEGKGVPLSLVLEKLRVFLSELDDVKIWGNGSDFDNAMLNHAYKGSPPWKPWNNRCYRTIAGQYPHIKRINTGTYHNALDDAKSQADHLLKLVQHVK